MRKMPSLPAALLPPLLLPIKEGTVHLKRARVARLARLDEHQDPPHQTVTTPLVRRGQGTSDQHSEGEGGQEVVMGEEMSPADAGLGWAGLGWAPWRCSAQVPAAAWPPLLSSD